MAGPIPNISRAVSSTSSVKPAAVARPPVAVAAPARAKHACYHLREATRSVPTGKSEKRRGREKRSISGDTRARHRILAPRKTSNSGNSSDSSNKKRKGVPRRAIDKENDDEEDDEDSDAALLLSLPILDDNKRGQGSQKAQRARKRISRE